MERLREVLKTIYFPLDTHTLDEKSRTALAEVAGFLKEYPDLSVSIGGHCDERGTVEYNLALGEKRARTVSDYIRAFGIAEGRVKVVSFGEESPAREGHDEEAYRMNRRAEFAAPL
jgi:peptidoglycan-associated lipoprotein